MHNKDFDVMMKEFSGGLAILPTEMMKNVYITLLLFMQYPKEFEACITREWEKRGVDLL